MEHDEKKQCKKDCKRKFCHKKNKDGHRNQHLQENHRGGKHHHLHILLMVIVCTLFGVLLGRCCMKCGRNRRGCKRRTTNMVTLF